MSQNIKAGDLVMVVRHPCCGATIGRPFRVASIEIVKPLNCTACGRVYQYPQRCAYSGDDRPGRVAWIPLPWLIRIDPPALTVTEKEEMTA